MRHPEVINSVVKWVRKRGYKVGREEDYVLDRPLGTFVKPDIVAINKGIRIGIECKGNELEQRDQLYKAFGQAIVLQGIFPFVYLATSSKIFQQPFFLNRAKELDIGIILVDGSKVKVISESRNTVQGIMIKKTQPSSTLTAIDKDILYVLRLFEPMRKEILIDWCSSWFKNDIPAVRESIDKLLSEGSLKEAKVGIKLG